MYELLFEKRVFKDLDRISDTDVARVESRMRTLSENPLPRDSKKLVGETKMYRIRQGPYRIIYTVDHKQKEVRILAIRHRKDASR